MQIWSRTKNGMIIQAVQCSIHAGRGVEDIECVASNRSSAGPIGNKTGLSSMVTRVRTHNPQF